MSSIEAPLFPPPLSFIGYIISLKKYLLKKCKSISETGYYDSKYYTKFNFNTENLTDIIDDTKEDYLYDKKYAEIYLRTEKISEYETTNSRINSNTAK